MYVNNYEEYLEYVESVRDQIWPDGLLPEIVTIRDERDPKKLEKEREAENHDQEAYEDFMNELALDEHLMEKAEAKKELTFEEREEIQRENE